MARKKKNKGLKVDFSGVEGRVLLPERDFHAKVLDIEQKTSDNSGEDYLAWEFETIDDDKKFNGKKAWYNTSLQAAALWNLRNLIETLGVEIPEDGEMELDLKEYKGLELIITIEHETYKGKKKAKVVDFAPVDGDDDDDAEVEDDEAEDGDDEDGDEEEEDGDEEGEDDEDEDEDAETYSSEEINDMTAKELLEVIEKHELDIKGFEKLKGKKKHAAVIDALEEAELLSDDEDEDE